MINLFKIGITSTLLCVINNVAYADSHFKYEESYSREKIGYEDIRPIIENRCSKCHNSRKYKEERPNLQDPRLFSAGHNGDEISDGDHEDEETIRGLLYKELIRVGDMPKEGPKFLEWPRNERQLMLGFIKNFTFKEAEATRLPLSRPTSEIPLVEIKLLFERQHEKTVSENKIDGAKKAELEGNLKRTLGKLDELKMLSDSLNQESLSRKNIEQVSPSGKIIVGGGWDIYKIVLILEGTEDENLNLGFDPYGLNKQERQYLFDWLQQNRIEVSPMEFNETQLNF